MEERLRQLEAQLEEKNQELLRVRKRENLLLQLYCGSIPFNVMLFF